MTVKLIHLLRIANYNMSISSSKLYPNSVLFLSSRFEVFKQAEDESFDSIFTFGCCMLKKRKLIDIFKKLL